jgi:hypothetical protein
MNRGTIRSSDILQGVLRYCPLSIARMWLVIGLLNRDRFHDEQVRLEPALMRRQNDNVNSYDSVEGVVVRSR